MRARLLAVSDPEIAAKRIIEKGLNVRDVERMAQDEQMQPAPETKSAEGKPAKREKDPDTRALEKALEDVLGMVVSISHGARGGELRIKYKTLGSTGHDLPPTAGLIIVRAGTCFSWRRQALAPRDAHSDRQKRA